MPVPEDVIYVPSVDELEALDVAKELQNRAYGGLPIQIGYCNGHNKKLNAVEYHRNSEINVAATDLVLLSENRRILRMILHTIHQKSKLFLYRQAQPLRCMPQHCIMRPAM